MKTIKDILNLRNDFSSNEKEIIKKAYNFAKKVHKGQKFDGTKYPYFIHPAYAGWLLAKWNQDHEAICAGLLHDVVEDCEVSLEKIRIKFGDRITFLVDGMSWERKWNYKENRYLKDWDGFHRKISKYTLHDPVIAIIHAADELSKLDDIKGKKFKKKDKKPKKTKKRYSRIMKFMVPFYREIGLTNVSDNVYEKIKDHVKKEKSELSKYLNKKQLNIIKSKLKRIKGIEELK
jgi:GTP diphosphokinase / guanosine-3',5'-bis(diphosphate) 3'-diphosphatase